MLRNQSCATRLLCSLTVIFAFALMSSNRAAAQCGTTGPTGAVTWTTQWCDEFNGVANSAISSSNWTYDTGNGGFGNNELETYCDPASSAPPCDSSNPNARIDGAGHLAIQVRSPSLNVWTSARLKSQGLQTFHSGRIEASLQIPSHAGLWPAFWLLGAQPGVNWPLVGESDIMENWPTASNIAGPGAVGNCSTIHTQITAGNGKGKCFGLPNGGRIDNAFHSYGQIWSANMVQFYIDDPTQPYFVVTASDLPTGDTWPFSKAANPFFIILNIAVGGTLGAPTDAATGSQPPMFADYIRQYLPSAVTPQLTQPAAVSLTAGAVTGNTSALDLTQTQGTGRTTFSCATTAPKATCIVTSTDTVNNHTVDFTNSSSAAATVTISTTTNASSAGIANLSWLTLIGSGVLLALVSLVRHRARKFSFATGLLCVVLAVGAWPACGGGGSGGGGGGGGGGGSTGTTPGAYTVTVNAYSVSSSDAATPSATTTFNLTVK